MDHQWVADLVEVQRISRYNRVYRYLLTVIDVLSTFAWVQPLKAKTGIQLVKAFEKILKQGRRPIQLQTDQGKEFYNQTFQRFLKQQRFIIFPRTEMLKTQWWNGSTVHWRLVCIVISRRPMRYDTKMYHNLWCENTMRVDTEASKWHPRTWRGKTSESYGNACTGNDWKRRRIPSSR